jgi:drug/metabolite transporter (DMT)-like permease
LIAWLRERPIAAGVLGAATIAFSAILVALAEVTPETAALFRCVYALPVLALLAMGERRRLGPRGRGELLWGALAGAFFSADLIFWHHSIENVGAGLATVLANLQVVLVAFLAWALLDERPDRRVVLAVPLALFGALLISGTLEDGAYGDDPVKGTVFGALTTVAYSGFLLVLRRTNAGGLRPAGPLLDATAASAVVTLAVGASYGAIDLLPGAEAQAWLVLLALSSQVVGWLLISISLPRLPAALVSLLLLVQPVSSVALATVLLDERPTAMQICGVAIICFVVLFAARSRPEPRPAA